MWTQLLLGLAAACVLLGGCGGGSEASDGPALQQDGSIEQQDAGPSGCESLQAAAQQFVNQERETGAYPGLVFGFDLPGCGTWTGASGVAVVDPSAPMKLDDVMMAGSVTKTVTAAVVLQLADEGQLDLDDTLSTWWADVANADTITLRLMLAHRSGIADYIGLAGCRPAATPITRDAILACIKAAAPSFAPDAKFAYSNSNFFLLALVAEAVTGTPIHELVRARLLTPLGLSSTGFLGESTTAHDVHYYLGSTDVTGTIDPSYGLGDGDLVSNAQDLLTWVRRLVTGDALSTGARQEMQQLRDTGEIFFERYGLGLTGHTITDDNGDPLCDVMGHSGRTLGQAEIYYSPEWDTAVVLLTNRASYTLSFGLKDSFDRAVRLLSTYR